MYSSVKGSSKGVVDCYDSVYGSYVCSECGAGISESSEGKVWYSDYIAADCGSKVGGCSSGDAADDSAECAVYG